MTTPNACLWRPQPEQQNKTRMTRFQAEASPLDAGASYEALHAWSVANPSDFWSAIWDFFEVIGDKGKAPYRLPGEHPTDTRWFPHARLNFAENLLRGPDETLAVIAEGEQRQAISLSYGDLRKQSRALAAWLRQQGVKPGDRVAALLPNAEHALIALLATSQIGAVFSSCSPDFGEQGVLDRFGQIEPKVLVAVNGYHYGGKAFDIRDKVRSLQSRLSGLQAVLGITADSLNGLPPWEGTIDCDWASALNTPGISEYHQGAFDAPLCILYSSGTTGAPKCIVHSQGGTLLQHLKELGLHSDIHAGDRLFYFSTCGWMMWNWQASALALGATLVTYDGSPVWPSPDRLWQLAEDQRITHFGASARFYAACDKAGIRPGETHDLSSLRTLLSTGSPLAPETFDYLYEAVKKDLCVSSISGGTDIISCFALGNPNLPVHRGELQCAGLGMDLQFLASDGTPLPAGKGELACLNAFPSMPIGFWNDQQKTRYHKAYFERFPGIWAHGDFGEYRPHDADPAGIQIHGRSDAVLNPGGVRIGTAEIYRQVETLEEVLECLAIGQPWQGDERIVLFVKLRHGVHLDESLQKRIRQTLRERASPRHVPAVIAEVSDIPRTRSGKIVELAVRQTVLGQPVQNQNALENPEALEAFRNHPALTES